MEEVKPYTEKFCVGIIRNDNANAIFKINFIQYMHFELYG